MVYGFRVSVHKYPLLLYGRLAPASSGHKVLYQYDHLVLSMFSAGKLVSREGQILIQVVNICV